jgi:hypothetical protein
VGRLQSNPTGVNTPSTRRSKTVAKYPIDPEWQVGLKRVIGVQPVFVWDREAPGRNGRKGAFSTDPKLDETTGYPLWDVELPVKSDDGRRSETVMVRVPHPGMPEVEDERVVFGGLVLIPTANTSGFDDKITANAGVKFEARTVALADAPSQRPVSGVKPPAPVPTPTHDQDNGKVGASA